MGWTYGGEPCLDPQTLLRSCIERDLRTDWYGNRGPNHFILPIGCRPGTGKILLAKKSLDKLTSDPPKVPSVTVFPSFDLIISQALGDIIPLQDLVITGEAVCLTPGASSDPDSAYLVSIADQRWHAWYRGELVTKAYNYRECCYGGYLKETLYNGLTAWTWQQIIDDLWPDGWATDDACSDLPFAPDEPPENICIRGMTTGQALEYVLQRLSAAVWHDPRYQINNANSLDIVWVGDPEVAPQSEHLLDKLFQQYRIDDSFSNLARWTPYPQKIRVEFPVKPSYQNGTPDVYKVDVTLTAADTHGGFVEPSTIIRLQDDLTAKNANTNITNAAALTTRATERTDDWLNRKQFFDDPLYRVYSGIWNMVALLGERFGTMAWEDRGLLNDKIGGARTSISSGGYAKLEDWWLSDECFDCNGCAQDCGCPGPDPGPAPPPGPPGSLTCLLKVTPPWVGAEPLCQMVAYIPPNEPSFKCAPGSRGFWADELLPGSPYYNGPPGSCNSVPGDHLCPIYCDDFPPWPVPPPGGGSPPGSPPPGPGCLAQCEATCAAAYQVGTPEYAQCVVNCFNQRCAGGPVVLNNPAMTAGASVFPEQIMTSGGATGYGLEQQSNKTFLPAAIAGGLSITKATADQSVTSSTTLVDSTYLTKSVEANTTYKIDVFIRFHVADATPGPGIKYRLLGPAAPTRINRVIRTWIAGAVAEETPVRLDAYDAGDRTYAPSSNTEMTIVHEEIHLDNGANAGTVKIQFAQNTSDTDATTLKKGSLLETITF